MNNYSDRFLEAMKVVSNKKQVAADYDKTIRAQIAGIPTEDKKYYTIQYNDLQYKVRTWYEEYAIGDVVYVRVIGGKMDGDKIIEGKVAPILQDRNSTSMVEIPMSKKWNLFEGDVWIDDDWMDLYKNDQKLEYFNGSLKQNCLRITCDFSAFALTEINFLEDYYGIKINLTNGREYEFTCKDFMGNPYIGEKVYQTYDIYFSEPIESPGVWIENITPIRKGQYSTQTIKLSNLTAQFITVKSYSDEEWTMTYSTDTGYIREVSGDKVIIKSRLFKRGKELFEKDLEDNQSVIIEHLSPKFKWEQFEVVSPGTDYDFTDIHFNEYYIRYKFIEKINQEEKVLASSDIIKIQNKTLPSKEYKINQTDNYATETTGLYLGSDFKLTNKKSGYWGYGSLEEYESYSPVQVIKDGTTEHETLLDDELLYRQIFSTISSLPNAMVMSYIREEGNYYLIKKTYTAPTADEQARQLTTSMHLFPKSVIVKYDADGVLGSNNQIYKITPNSSFFPANEEKIQRLEWTYKVNNLYVYYDNNNDAKESDKGTTVTGIYTWIWEKELISDNNFKWVNKGFIFSHEERLEEDKKIVAPVTAKGNLFASFSQGANGELQFTAVNKYNKHSANFNDLTFSIIYKDESKIDYPFEVNFLADGNLGTNGTKYALIIEDFWRDELNPYITSRDWNGLYLRAQLLNTETNQIIPDSAITWEWVPNFVDRLYWLPAAGRPKFLKDNEGGRKESLEANFKSSVLDFSKFYTEDGVGKYFNYYLADSIIKVSGSELLSPIDFPGELAPESINYIELIATYDTNTIVSTYTIPIISNLTTPKGYEDRGNFTLPSSNIQYSSDHTSVIGNSSDTIKVYLSTSNIPDIESITFNKTGNWKNYCELSETYIIKSGETGLEYSSTTTKLNNKPGDTVLGKQLSIKYKTLAADMTNLINNNYDYFGIYITYPYLVPNVKSLPQKTIGKTFSVSCNRYFNAMINDWDGKSKLIEDAVLTPQVIAGSKNELNGFSGAMIGRVDDKPNGPEGPTRTRYGVFGYGNGKENFGIDSSTGDAHFEGNITARSLSFSSPEVVGEAGLKSDLVGESKQALINCQFKNYPNDNKDRILGYVKNNPGIYQNLQPFQNKKDSQYYDVDKPETEYFISLPYYYNNSSMNYPPYGFQFVKSYSLTSSNNSFNGTPERIYGEPTKRLYFTFTAKFSEQCEVVFTTGQIGISKDVGKVYWLTDRKGTGKFKEYKLFIECGPEPLKDGYWIDGFDQSGSSNVPKYGTTGYFYIKYSGEDTDRVTKFKEEKWFLSSAACYEIQDGTGIDGSDLVGKFAGWHISQNALKYKETEDATYLHSFIQPSVTSNESYTVGNSDAKKDWAMYFGGSNSNIGNFGVDQDGHLYATGVNISGNLIIGEDGEKVEDYVDNKIKDIEFSFPEVSEKVLEVTTGINQYNGKSYYRIKDPSGKITGNYFSIATDGALYAQNAIIKGTIVSGSTITGTVYANDGKIADWDLLKTSVTHTLGDGKTEKTYSDISCLQLEKGMEIDYGSGVKTKNYKINFLLREPTPLIFNDTGNAILALTISDSDGKWKGNNLRLRADGRMETTGLALLNLDLDDYKNRVQGLLDVNDGTIKLGTADSATNFTGGHYIEIDNTHGTLEGTWTGAACLATSSDINKKNTIASINSAYSDLFDNLRPVTYKYNDGTSDRLHTGFIAQEVKNALDIARISTKDFAGLVIKDQGKEDESWYLRYEEFIALNTQQIQKAKARISELEERVSQLENLLQANSN